MPIDPISIAMVAAPLVQGAMDLAFQGHNQQQQLQQQQALTDQQVQAQKQLGRFNYRQSMRMWEETNYSAQREQMEKAGLNIGLMYGKGGPGGSTQGGQAGSATGGQAAQAPAVQAKIGMALEAALMAAQVKNIEADTEKKLAETANTGAGTDLINVQIQNMLQATANAKVQNAILEYEKDLKAIQTNVEGKTQEETIKQRTLATNRLMAELTSAQAKGEIDQATKNNIIKGAELANEAASAGITQTKTQTKATEKGIEATQAGIEQTKQNTKNLQQEEINKILSNQMKANGIEPTDNAVVRMMQRWLGENNISIESLNKKMQKIGAWMKGEYGEQTWARLEQLMKE